MTGDHLLAAAGLALALASAALPWHVWTNPSAYEGPRLALERLDPAGSEPPTVRAAAGPPLVTGSITPPPPARRPTLVFVSATHALARFPDRADLALLRVGSRLGEDRVARFELHDGRWAVLTAGGAVLSVRP